MKKFYFVNKDYHNESLNSLARRIAEYNTAELLLKNYEVEVVDKALPGLENHEIGKISVDPSVPYTVEDIHIINDIFNYNLYFEKNTSAPLTIPLELKGSFDCLVSLGSGDMIKNNPIIIDFQGDNHYVIDISPTAIHKSMGIYKENVSQYIQLDIFNQGSVNEFLKGCKGSRGIFVISNCFMYIVNSLIYDVNLRLKIQNQFIKQLVEDKIEWYVNIITADGSSFSCIKASKLLDKQLDTRFKSLPWINL